MKPIIVIGLPQDIGGACRESADVIQLWRASNIPVAILPCHPIKPDNPWPLRLTQAGCKIEAPFLGGKPPAWLRDSLVVDFQAQAAVRHWPELKRRGCKLIHAPCHTFVMSHEHATFAHFPPTAVVCQSEFQRSAISMQYAAYGVQTLHRIPAAFDMRFFPYRPCPHDGKLFVIGVIGRDDVSKWPPRILTILKAAKQSGVNLRARFLGWTPAMERHCGKLPPWVHVLPPGKLSTAAFLADCHALLCCSDYLENAPRVVMEGMSSGVPVVADARGGYLEQIRHGETGMLAPNEQGAACCLTELATDEPLRLKLARTARDSLCRLAPQDAIQAAWKALFAEIL
jgi:glycosyltransferase involved in cell wall biosynthesis